MTIHLAQAFASLSYAGRNPTWQEYESAAPCEKRAIIERWQEIIAEPNYTEDWLPEVAKALGRRNQALAKPQQKVEDELQRDYELLDSYRQYEHGE